MSLSTPNPSSYARIADLDVYGFLPGPETTGWHHAAELHVSDGTSWLPVYKDGGVPPTGLGVIPGTPAGGATVDFVATWTVPAGASFSDYEVGQWYDWSSGSAEALLGSSGYFVSWTPSTRTLVVTSYPAQVHKLSFSVRRKADPTWDTPASAYAESGVAWWTDPRDPV